jgi:hypothetical protein
MDVFTITLDGNGQLNVALAVPALTLGQAGGKHAFYGAPPVEQVFVGQPTQAGGYETLPELVAAFNSLVEYVGSVVTALGNGKLNLIGDQ